MYTQRFNRSHPREGQLFRGRYKSILVDAGSYVLELVRYIHRNPLEAGLVDRLDKYLWGSQKGYLSDAKKWTWLYKDFVLSLFSNDSAEGRKGNIQLTEGRGHLSFETVKGDRLDEIGKEFKMAKYSSVSSVIQRMKGEISRNRKLRNRVQQLEEELQMSQEQL